MRSKHILMTTAALSLMIGSAGYAAAQTSSSDDAKGKQTIQKQDQERTNHNRPAKASADQDKNKTSGQASSDTSKTTQKKPDSTSGAGETSQNAAPKNSDDNGNSNPPSKQSSDSTKPGPAPNDRSNSAQPSTASDTNKTQPAAASNANRSEPSAATESNKSQPSTAQQPTQNQNAAKPSTNTQTNTAESRQNTRLSAELKSSQKTQVTQAFAKLSVKPVAKVDFSVSVGTAVPTSVTLHPVPATVIEVIPQYRGYDFFVVRDEFVIVEPRAHKIVDVIERSGGDRAVGTTTTRQKLNLSQKDRTYIREHAMKRRTTTTGTAVRSESRVIVGEDAPETIEIEELPADVYRQVPAVRSYRYIHRGDDIYLVEPGSRRVIESLGED